MQYISFVQEQNFRGENTETAVKMGWSGFGTGFQKEKTEKKPMRNDERAREGAERH